MADGTQKPPTEDAAGEGRRSARAPGRHALRQAAVLSLLPLALLATQQTLVRLPGAEAGAVASPSPPVPMVATRSAGSAADPVRPITGHHPRPCDAEPPLTAEGTLRRVPAPGLPAVERDYFPPTARISWRLEGSPDLAVMAGTITQVTAANVVRYPGLRGPYYGVVPGDYYPEVYIRDLMTAGRAVQFLYGSAPLRTSLDEFLARVWTESTPDSDLGKIPYPGPDSLPGYLAPDGRAVKTTATSDEEASAIQLAYLHFKNGGGPEWLGCASGNRTVLQRLNAATERLFLGRLDPATGLVRRGHTTDWGDVRFQAVSAHTRSDPERERWTASIYDQAWTHLALLQLAEMNEATGQWEPASRWRREAVRLRENVQRFLWQPERGFFRLHLHLLPWRHGFDEDAMVAIGNAVAVYAGLAEPDQALRVFDALERARVRGGATKPGLSLQPSYPEGFFALPHMYHEGHYQNGGVWDWWGAVQVTAEFEHGASAAGLRHLLQMAQEWASHPGAIAEWQSPQTNRLEGSPNYAGAAGSASEAVIRGLFGVKLDAGGFALSPRLGERSGELRVTQPATGAGVWLRQVSSPQTIRIDYDATHSGPGTLRVLLPPDADAASVTFDGAPKAAGRIDIGLDRYVDLGPVPPGDHRVEVLLAPRRIPALAATWTASSALPVTGPGGVVRGQVTVRNSGSSTWVTGGNTPVRLGLRWQHDQGAPVRGAGESRAELPRPVAPGENVTIAFSATAPRTEGDLRLQVDLVQEHVTWFHEAAGSNQVLLLPALVTARPWDAAWVNVERDFAVRAGSAATLGVAARNVGTAHWTAGGGLPVRLGWQWWDAAGRPYQETGMPTQAALPADAAPGDVVRWDAAVRAPALPGRYTLAVDLVQGSEAFSRSAGSRSPVINVQVEP
jgi:hypothetical protein